MTASPYPPGRLSCSEVHPQQDIYHPDGHAPTEVPTLNLPAERHLSISLPLDVDAMRTASPEVRELLIAALRDAARQHREARGSVVTEEDTYPLVRRLVAAGEVMRQWSAAFEAAASEADALVAEEAVTAVGEQDGIANGSLFVPDGAGQRIAVKNDWKAGDSVWDVGSLIGWVAEQTVADEGRKPDVDTVNEGEEPGDVPLWTNDEAVSLCRDAIDKLLRLGKFTPGATAIEAERKRLAGLQRDADAAVLRQVRSVGIRTYKGMRITREQTS